MLQQVERGTVRLNMPVCEIIPEFGRKGKQRVTIGQLLCHSGGLPASFPAVPADKIGDLDAVVDVICDVGLEAVPGGGGQLFADHGATRCWPSASGACRAGPRFRDIAQRNLLTPLGMAETSLGHDAGTGPPSGRAAGDR